MNVLYVCQLCEISIHGMVFIIYHIKSPINRLTSTSSLYFTHAKATVGAVFINKRCIYKFFHSRLGPFEAWMFWGLAVLRPGRFDTLDVLCLGRIGAWTFCSLDVLGLGRFEAWAFCSGTFCMSLTPDGSNWRMNGWSGEVIVQ
jgi:hypothetical protein